MRTIRALPLLILLGPASCANAPPADNPKLLDKAEVIELLSLDPKEGEENEGFHGYAVLGSVKLMEKSDRERLLKAFHKGIDDSDGVVAACFIPRHGLRAKVDGKLIEIVICFQCLSMQVYVEGKPRSVLTTGSPAATFNAILKEHKVPLPPGSEGK